MRLLLDTHALLWWTIDSPKLGKAARAAIGEEDNDVLVSAVSAMEVATKYRIGKLPEAAILARDFGGAVANEGFLPLSITLAHASLAGGLQFDHGDPFDRMLIAQARLEEIPLVSNEAVFDGFGVERIW